MESDILLWYCLITPIYTIGCHNVLLWPYLRPTDSTAKPRSLGQLIDCWRVWQYVCHTCVVRVFYVCYTLSFVPYMRFTYVKRVSYMCHTCVIRASYVCHTCIIFLSLQIHKKLPEFEYKMVYCSGSYGHGLVKSASRIRSVKLFRFDTCRSPWYASFGTKQH